MVAALTPGSHQLVDWTAPDRYPEIFAAAAAAAPDARRILSFGCSTGEECVSLAQYFPKAENVGAEINVLSLLKAMKKRSDRIRFVYSSDRILSRLGGFDVVFCMAVLRAPKAAAPRQLSVRAFSRNARCFLNPWFGPGAYS